MKAKKPILFLLLMIVIVANAATMTTSSIDCSYSNDNGSFTFEEKNSKERNFDMCLRKFEEFKKQAGDTTLYRLCEKNVLKFWHWGNYLLGEKFKLPYRSWKEIEMKRGAIVAKTGFQDF
jgi:hypothetical protein